jgi:hypothetical protein
MNNVLHFKEGCTAFLKVEIFGAIAVVPFFGKSIKGLIDVIARYEDLLSCKFADPMIEYSQISAEIATSWKDACLLIQTEVPMSPKKAERLIRAFWPKWAGELDAMERLIKVRKHSQWDFLASKLRFVRPF